VCDKHWSTDQFVGPAGVLLVEEVEEDEDEEEEAVAESDAEDAAAS